MKKYFYLQIKRAAKLFPFVAMVTLVLLLSVGLILSGLVSKFRSGNEAQSFQVALCGDTDDEYLQWGLTALQTIDTDHFAFSVVEMPEDAARAALERGEISAYVVLPENFMERALAGDVDPVTYVTSVGAEGVSSMLKKEVTSIVTDMVVYSQRGTYGMEEALKDHAPGEDVYDHMTNLSFEYTDFIFHRGDLYAVTELGISDGLTTRDYYICAMMVLLLVLTGIPYAILYVKRDYALSRLLISRGFSTGRQLVCEFGTYLLCMLTLMALIFLAVVGATVLIPNIPLGSLPSVWKLLGALLPALLMLSAMNMLLFTISDNLVSGFLMHFFVAIGLCYVSGCIYPASTFPKAMWRIADLLPTGMVRVQFASCFTKEFSGKTLLGILLYAVVFYLLTWLLRAKKTVGLRRAKV